MGLIREKNPHRGSGFLLLFGNQEAGCFQIGHGFVRVFESQFGRWGSGSVPRMCLSPDQLSQMGCEIYLQHQIAAVG